MMLKSLRLRIGGWAVAVFTLTLAAFTIAGIVAVATDGSAAERDAGGRPPIGRGLDPDRLRLPFGLADLRLLCPEQQAKAAAGLQRVAQPPGSRLRRSAHARRSQSARSSSETATDPADDGKVAPSG